MSTDIPTPQQALPQASLPVAEWPSIARLNAPDAPQHMARQIAAAISAQQDAGQALAAVIDHLTDIAELDHAHQVLWCWQERTPAADDAVTRFVTAQKLKGRREPHAYEGALIVAGPDIVAHFPPAQQLHGNGQGMAAKALRAASSEAIVATLTALNQAGFDTSLHALAVNTECLSNIFQGADVVERVCTALKAFHGPKWHRGTLTDQVEEHGYLASMLCIDTGDDALVEAAFAAAVRIADLDDDDSAHYLTIVCNAMNRQNTAAFLRVARLSTECMRGVYDALDSQAPGRPVLAARLAMETLTSPAVGAQLAPL